MPVSFRGEVSGLEESRCFHMGLEERILDSHRKRGSGEGNKRATASSPAVAAKSVIMIVASGKGKVQRRLAMVTEAAQHGSLDCHDSRYTGVCANRRRFQGGDHSLHG